jgi:predicted Zn-dependent protease
MALTQSEHVSGQAAADAAALFNSAVQFYSARSFEGAEAACRRVLALVPTHGDALHMLGVLHVERGQCAPAADFLRKATDVNPQAAHYWLSLGMATRTSERVNRVIDHDQAASMEKKKQEGYF